MFWFSSKYKIYAYREKAFNENNHSFMIKKNSSEKGHGENLLQNNKDHTNSQLNS